MSDSKEHKLIELQQKNTYNSYQLTANTKPCKNPEKQFILCLLYTYEWLRKRFGENKIKNLEMPDPSKADSVKLSDFKSFSINNPYQLDIVYYESEKSWALRLIEPDNGNSQRQAVHGRMYETNIAYTMGRDCVQCGFKTVVTDPQNCKEKSEAFRLGCIRKIAEDENLGLYHNFELTKGTLTPSVVAELSQIRAWIKSEERELPIAFIVMRREEKKKTNIENISVLNPNVFAAPDGLRSLQSFSKRKEVENPIEPVKFNNIEKLEELFTHTMGYAQVITLDGEYSEKYAQKYDSKLGFGELHIYEPVRFGGDEKIYRLDNLNNTNLKEIERLLTNNYLGKEFDFSKVKFVPELKDYLAAESEELKRNLKDLEKAIKEAQKSGNKESEALLEETQKSLSEALERERKLKEKIANLEKNEKTKNENIARELQDENSALKKELEEKNFELERYHAKERRPQTPQKVAKWVKDEFEGKLIFHKKAIDLMKEVGPNEVNLELLCDALEYLAKEYRDKQIGEIDEDEMKARASKKYNRPFSVEPLLYETPEKLSSDYKIKYYKGFNGRLVESPLDLHLKVGNRTDELIRIYFLYDKDKKLIVVGSLPKHLPTFGYR